MGLKGPKPGDAGYHAPVDRKERILRRIEVVDTCWVWSGPKDEKGYGRTFFGSRVDGTRKSLRIHRVAYEEWVGPIPAGLTIDHLCENKSCCNPEHLQAVTNAENNALRGKRMTHCKRGHPRTPENTKTEDDGRIRCLICARQALNARRAARKAAGMPRD